MIVGWRSWILCPRNWWVMEGRRGRVRDSMWERKWYRGRKREIKGRRGESKRENEERERERDREREREQWGKINTVRMISNFQPDSSCSWDGFLESGLEWGSWPQSVHWQRRTNLPLQHYGSWPTCGGSGVLRVEQDRDREAYLGRSGTSVNISWCVKWA